MLLIRIRPCVDPYCNQNKNLAGSFWISCVFYSTLHHLPPSDSTVSKDAAIDRTYGCWDRPKDDGIEPMKWKFTVETKKAVSATLHWLTHHCVSVQNPHIHKKPTSELPMSEALSVNILFSGVYTVRITDLFSKIMKDKFFCAGSF